MCKGMKKLILVILFCLFPLYTDAQSKMTSQQIERVKASKLLLAEVHAKSLEQTMTEIEGSSYPEGQLQILEAVAKTYTDIVKDYDVQTQDKKRWLYSMVLLNMAYFQLRGDQQGQDDASALNQLIQQKLKRYLPMDLFSHPKLFQSFE